MKQWIFIGIIFSLAFAGCYSLSGISIDPNANTFTVTLFENRADLIEPTLARELTEDLKDKVRNSSRLKQNDDDPDLEFSGVITEYRTTSEAPQAGATTAFNRLTITVRVSFTNHKNEKDNWEKSFSRFANYSSSENFATVRESLIDEINMQLVEDIFNEAFAKKW